MQSQDDYIIIKMFKDVHLPYWCAGEKPQLDIILKAGYTYRLPKSLAQIIQLSKEGYYWTTTKEIKNE